MRTTAILHPVLAILLLAGALAAAPGVHAALIELLAAV